MNEVLNLCAQSSETLAQADHDFQQSGEPKVESSRAN